MHGAKKEKPLINIPYLRTCCLPGVLEYMLLVPKNSDLLGLKELGFLTLVGVIWNFFLKQNRDIFLPNITRLISVGSPLPKEKGF